MSHTRLQGGGGHTEWQCHFAAHYITMEKSAQPGEGGGARQPPFTILRAITYKVVVYALAERAGTLALFLLYPYMYSVGGSNSDERTDTVVLYVYCNPSTLPPYPYPRHTQLRVRLRH
jgi:hypothetical protein